MTISEYKKLDAVYTAKAEQEMHEESKYVLENADELMSKYRRQQLKAFRTETLGQEKREKEVERESYTTLEEADNEPTAAQPYGKWQTVARTYAY